MDRESELFENEESEYTRLMKNDSFWKRITKEKKLLNHLPMNHRKNILERFTILQQGEG